MEKTKNKGKSILNTTLAISTPFALFNISKYIIERNTYKKTDDSQENEIGYENFSNFINSKVHSNNFVVLHINNKKISDVTSLKTKILNCNEKGISVSLVLDTDASNLSEIYSDIDFLQSILKDCKIDLPIYCNIDEIMSNKKLDNLQKEQIISAFIDKMSSSNYYIGLYGNDTNLCYCNDYIINLKNYDCFLVQDEENIKYSGIHTITKDINDNIISSENLATTILTSNLNNSSKIAYSTSYIVKEYDTISSIALQYGLSENDLLKYNHIRKIEVGDIIYIPNLYQYSKLNKNVYEHAIARGIDISDYQTKIDWNKVSENCDFVITEVARDCAHYENNNGYYLINNVDQIKQVISNNLDLGLYFCIEKDMKVSVYESRLEEYLVQLDRDLKENNIVLDKSSVPVFLDFEFVYDYNDYLELMNVFEKVCSNHGYEKYGIYGNSYTLKSICNKIRTKESYSDFVLNQKWFVWEAGGPQYSNEDFSGYSINELQEYQDTGNEEYFSVDIQQITNVCNDIGASNDSNHCDVDYLYNDELFGKYYDETTETIGYDLNRGKNLPVENVTLGLINSFTVLASVGYTILAVKAIGKKIVIKCKKKSQEKVLKK